MKERFGKRLQTARKMAGMSQDELVRQIEEKVTKNAISKYEKGKMIPDQEKLEVLAKALGVKQNYFFRSFQVEVGEVSFRKTSKLKKSEQDRLKGVTSDRLERYLELEELLGIREAFQNPLGQRDCSSFEDAQSAANDLRKEWGLGSNPIPNLLEMLENNGVKVVELSASDQFDGLSTYYMEEPVIVLNEDLDITRKRFTTLHELGHLLLSFPDDVKHRQVEKLCHAFASEMLIPESVLVQELGPKRSHIDLRELVDLKEYYGISIAALVQKTQKSGIISDGLARRFWMNRNKDENLKKEIGEIFGDYKGKERSDRFFQLILRGVSEGVVSMSKAADLAQMKLAEFRDKSYAL